MADTFDNPNTYASVAQTLQYYKNVFLNTATPKYALYNLGTKDKMPMNSGKTFIFARPTSFTVGTYVTPGTPPESDTYELTEIEATIRTFVRGVTLTDDLEVFGSSAIKDSVVTELGKVMSKDIDTYNRTEVLTGTPVYANGTSTAEITSAHTLSAELVRSLYVTQAEAGYDGVLNDKHVLVTSPKGFTDFIADDDAAGWIEQNKYTDGGRKEFNNLEKVTYHGITIMSANNVYSALDGSGSGRVYRSILLSDQGLGTVLLGGSNTEILMKSRKEGGAANWHEMYSAIGAKVQGYSAKVLDVLRVRPICHS